MDEGVLLANHDVRRYLWRFFSRRSSAVEHPLRKRVVGGSNPSAGTTLAESQVHAAGRRYGGFFANSLK
jgi:hypothetical protein